MADNVVTNPGLGGETFATDDIGGVQYPRSKIGYGVDGSYVDVSDSNPLPASVVGSNGVEAGVTQYGYLRVTQEPSSLFSEQFDALDTTVRWTARNASGGSAAVSAGVLAISAGTTASAYGGLSTQPTFSPNGLNFLALGCTLIIPTWTQANTKRFWGFGSVPGTPTTAIPVTDGAGFEIDGAGNFLAVVYESTTRTQAINLNSVRPANGVPFYTAIARRADRIDFYVNSTLNAAATVLIPTLDISTLPGYIIAINAGTAPAAAPTMTVTAFGIADTGQNAQSIKDPTNPFIQATVKRASTAAAATDTALVVSFAGANSATRVGDGTNNAAIKAASTAAVAADPSLVVALHPSSPLNGQSAAGSAIAGNPVRIAGSDGTNTRNVLTDAAGYLLSPLPFPQIVADVASAALTTTTTTAAFTPAHGQAYQIVIPVTAVTGTTPTLDVGVEESDDTGTNWLRVFDFPRITATGIYRSPKLSLRGNRVRYVQTVTGTTPSFTRAVQRIQYSDSVPQIAQLVDRTIALGTSSSTTPSLNVQRCTNAQLVIAIGAATTPPTLQLQGSDDNGATWYNVGATLAAVASNTVQLTVNNVNSQLLRANVTAAGTSVTPNYVLIKGF